MAISNLQPLAHQVDPVLDTEQRQLVGRAADQVAGIDRDTLPTTRPPVAEASPTEIRATLIPDDEALPVTKARLGS